MMQYLLQVMMMHSTQSCVTWQDSLWKCDITLQCARDENTMRCYKVAITDLRHTQEFNGWTEKDLLIINVPEQDKILAVTLSPSANWSKVHYKANTHWGRCISIDQCDPQKQPLPSPHTGLDDPFGSSTQSYLKGRQGEISIWKSPKFKVSWGWAHIKLHKGYLKSKSQARSKYRGFMITCNCYYN